MKRKIYDRLAGQIPPQVFEIPGRVVRVACKGSGENRLRDQVTRLHGTVPGQGQLFRAAHVQAVGGHRLAGFLQEELAERVGVPEAAEVGDGLQLLMGVAQEFLGPFEPHGVDGLEDRLTRGLAEADFSGNARTGE